ncbi:HAD-IIB family hydrolase [Salinisphaera sp. T31B1]|uniref:HAD-IIB family hydrolase n=1 Tax=Salinisphaera sp. T31B1 TaxID=727963 RepID=UPI0033404B3F
MFIMHVALQGCLCAGAVEYGITADTGGHIRYLMQLADASAADPQIDRIDIVTRAFSADFTSVDYQAPCEHRSAKIRVVRLATPNPGYLAKEALWPELPAFTRALNDYIAGLERAPDVVHAHYADAAEVAAGVKAEHGIGFVFTAHSLGRVKRRHQPAAAGADSTPALDRRIAYEERALREADLVLASSRDEAEIQYADYAAYEPGRIRILAPGIDVSPFAEGAIGSQVDAMLGRFLSEPDKPALLAIARPVSRKNLGALIRAYGESPALQARANLVLLAGHRDRIDDLEAELAANLREILALIDRYDLYGKIAYPKQHVEADVPGVYAWARARQGMFVNPAFNEPFGLTLLEAAAAGLPVIATDSGGPNDIIERCGNGLLINPAEPSAITEAALDLLDDPERWQRYSAAGKAAVTSYDWHEHARRYHELLGRLANDTPSVRIARSRALLVSDIDGTLTGCALGIDSFNGWLAREAGVTFGVATGRSFHSAMAVLEASDIAAPRFLITSVGAEIHYLAEDGVTYRRDRRWHRQIDRHWHRERIARALEGLPGLVLQGALEQKTHKISYLVADTPATLEAVRLRLHTAGLACSVIHSHGRYLDVLPAAASKGAAVEYLRQRLGLAPTQVMVAGDSGNDIDMLATSACPIIVANYRDDLAGQPGLSRAYRAGRPHAWGVIEGVRHFQERRQP